MGNSTDKYIGMMLDDRYEILELIGTGGMANVYKALCHRLNRYDAVKIMRDDTAKDESFRKRFKAESQAVAMLSHPNIVSVYDVSHSDGIEYIVMELVEGINLKQYMKAKGALSTEEVLNFTNQIAKALSHAHSKGIIHRDIKPQNVMLLKDGLIKVADFGIASLQSEAEESSEETVGSVHYIAPEQARGFAADARSDIYSLGIVMYEMMTGKLPYVGSSEVEVAVKHMNTDAAVPRSIVPSIPKGLEKICLKAMATNIEDRYQTADEMLNDLKLFAKHLSKSSSKGSNIAASEINSEQLEDKNSRKKTKKKKKFSIGSGIIAVLIFIILIFVFINGYFLKDLFSDPQKLEVGDFVGRYYEDVINDQDFNSIYKFTVTMKVDLEHDYGIIMEQSPSAKSEKNLNSKDEKIDVELIVSAGEVMPDEVQTDSAVPNVANKELSAAIKILKESGFTYIVTEAASDSITKDYVISTAPSAGELAPEGTQVIITVSVGPETQMQQVPKLIGLTKRAAIDKLESNNLSVGSVDSVDSEYDEGTVIWQSYDPGQSIEEHTKIDLQISSGHKSGET